MKKQVILLLFLAVAMVAGCSKSDDNNVTPSTNTEIKAKLNVEFEEVFENTIYPSTIFSTASLKNVQKDQLNYFNLKINSDKEFEGKIRVTNEKFINETIVEKKIKQGENILSLNVLWKYDNFVNITNSGYTHFKFELLDKNNKVITTENIQLSYRSINECVFALNEDGKISDTRIFFVSYVNEDSKLIDTFLSETLKNHNDKFGHEDMLNLPYGWAGYQIDDDYLAKQVWAIIYRLHELGMQYSSITDTSNSATKVFSQNVRFINESLKLKNANCVDGSVLVASILEKIGIRTFLVLEPGHMFLAYSKTGKIEPELSDLKFLETTLIGTSNYYDTIKEKKITNKNIFISIKKAREIGIKPIQ